MFDAKIVRVLFFHAGFLFRDFGHIRSSRPALQLCSQRQKLRRQPHGIDLDAPIAEVLHISGQAQTLRRSLRKVSVPYSLHGSRNIINSRDLRFCHFSALRSRLRTRSYQTPLNWPQVCAREEMLAEKPKTFASRAPIHPIRQFREWYQTDNTRLTILFRPSVFGPCFAL
jgi:hypothetical protein